MRLGFRCQGVEKLFVQNRVHACNHHEQDDIGEDDVNHVANQSAKVGHGQKP
jgi:hypothetical protein